MRRDNASSTTCRANSRCIGSSVVVGVFPADAIQESVLSGIVKRCSGTWTKAKAESKEGSNVRCSRTWTKAKAESKEGSNVEVVEFVVCKQHNLRTYVEFVVCKQHNLRTYI